MSFQAICVYCGSSSNARPIHFEAARQTARAIVNRGAAVVYGGARIGLMGEVANTALELGGRVVGVIPHTLVRKEVAHQGLSELHVVESMHDRKALFNELSQAFLALPGGFGTLDELFEILTWAQLRFHAKPVGLLNTGGYYDSLLAFVARASEEGFVHPAHRDLILTGTDPAELLERMAAWCPPRVDKPGIR